MQQCLVPPWDRLCLGSDPTRGQHPSAAGSFGEDGWERHGQTRVCRGAGLHREGGVFTDPRALQEGPGAGGEGELWGGAGHAGVWEQLAVPVRRWTAQTAKRSVKPFTHVNVSQPIHISNSSESILNAFQIFNIHFFFSDKSKNSFLENAEKTFT